MLCKRAMGVMQETSRIWGRGCVRRTWGSVTCNVNSKKSQLFEPAGTYGRSKTLNSYIIGHRSWYCYYSTSAAIGMTTVIITMVPAAAGPVPNDINTVYQVKTYVLKHWDLCFTHLILTIVSWSCDYYYLHFKGVEAVARRFLATYPILSYKSFTMPYWWLKSKRASYDLKNFMKLLCN